MAMALNSFLFLSVWYKLKDVIKTHMKNRHHMLYVIFPLISSLFSFSAPTVALALSHLSLGPAVQLVQRMFYGCSEGVSEHIQVLVERCSSTRIYIKALCELLSLPLNT